MRIRAHIDIRRPLKWKKQVIFNGRCSYVKFRYERLSLFCFYYGHFGHNDSFCEAKMLIGVKVAKLGWDLSLRAQSRKALSMNSIWLREDDDGKSEGEKRYIRGSTNRIWAADNTVRGGKVINPILGFNLERGSSNLDLQKENKISDWMNTVMEHDLEEGVIIGEE